MIYLFFAACAVLMIIGGFMMLNNRKLELAALIGIYPLCVGVAILFLTAFLYLANHLSVNYY